jgi:hypothetical protein
MLKRFSTWKVEDFIDQNNKERRHAIVFAETSEPDGFQNVPFLDRDQAGYAEGWQFAIDYLNWGCEWRAHGLLIDDTFYIVWLDPDHALYERKLLPAPRDPE